MQLATSGHNTAGWCTLQFVSDPTKNVAFCDVQGLRSFCAQPVNAATAQSQQWRFDLLADEGQQQSSATTAASPPPRRGNAVKAHSKNT